MLSKFILLAVILLLFVAITYRRESFEIGDLYGRRAADMNAESKVLSTMLYFQKEDEDVYLNNYQEQHPIDQLNEPLIMDRCIQFVYEGNRGGVDGIMSAMQNDRKCFVSNKITIDYTNYDMLESILKKTLMQLYVDSNRNTYVPQFYGPCYVLITQYPYVRTLKRDCSMLPKALQWDSLLGLFSPKPIDDVNGCAEVKAEITRKAIRAEMYLVFPAHDITLSGNRRLVGPFKYKKWEDIRCNMRRLFAYNPNKIPGVFTVNPRSFDEKCQVTCLNESDNIYKYACGARNSVRGKPYESVVLGTRTVDGSRVDERKHDYANLFLINPARMNLIMGMTSDSGIMRYCIDTEPIPLDFNTSYSCTPRGVSAIPTTPQVTLKGIAGATFNIRIGDDRCLVYQNGALQITDCGPEKYKRWFVEPVRVSGEGEPLYRIATRVGTRKMYLTRNGNTPVMTFVIPRLILFKPRTDRQLMLVNISRPTNRIEWSTNEKYCLALSGNSVVFERSNANNKNIVLVPVSDEDEICGREIDRGTYTQLMQYAKDQVAK